MAEDKKFVHLHNHSEFSTLDGLSKVKDMANKAKELGHDAIALTDHGTCAGLTAFYQACVDTGVKPILGLEAYITPYGHTRFEREKYDIKDMRGKPGHQSNRYHLILLCKDYTGYKNLCALTTASYSEGYYYKPRIDVDLLREHHEGLICSSACILGEVQHHLFCHDYDKAKEVALVYKDIFGDDFYLEIMNHGLDMEIQVMKDIRRLAEEIGVKVIATNDTHFVNEEDHKLQKTMMLLGMHKSWADDDVEGTFFDDDDRGTDRSYEDESGESDPIFSMPSALYLKTYDEMMEVIGIEGGENGVAEQELANTLEIADKCHCELPLIDPLDMSAYHTPIYNIEGDKQYEVYSQENYEIPKIVEEAIIREMLDDGREGDKLEDFLNEHEVESTRFLCWMCEKGVRELVRPKIEARGNPLPTEFWCTNPPEGLKIEHCHNSPDELWIKKQIEAGLSEDDIIQLYYERFSYEMAVILRKGFCDYFLIVQSYVNYSRFAGSTVGPGRGCLTGDSQVWTTSGYKQLRDIEIGDIVLGGSGNLRTVTATHQYECKEPLVQIDNFYGATPVKMTKDHKVLAVRQEKETNQRLKAQGYVWSREVANQPQWLEAQEINEGDFVVIPRFKTPVSDKQPPQIFDLAEYCNIYNQQHPNCPLDIDVYSDYIVERRPYNQHTAPNASKRAIARSAGISRNSLSFLIDYISQQGDIDEVYDCRGRRAARSTKALRKLRIAVTNAGFASVSDWVNFINDNTINTITYKRYIENNEDFAFLMGVMASDGCIRSLGTELNIADRKSTADNTIPTLFKKIFDVNITKLDHRSKDLTQWTLCSKLHTFFFADFLPNYQFTAQTKELPEWCYNLNVSMKQTLLRGLWWGDGSTSSKWTYTTTSAKLAFQIRNLLWDIGSPASLKEDRRFDTRPEYYGEHLSYRITCPRDFSPGRIMNSFVDDNYILMRVYNISLVDPEDYDGFVYDITVEEDHSYVTDSLLVHNSGAGSLVNYLIGITAVDPLPNDLLFGRFLAPARVGYPDIDCDFSKDFRDNELKPYLKSVYGDDCASAVATLMYYWGKAAIKAAGRVLFNPPMSVDYASQLCDLVDDAPKLDLNTQLAKNEDGTLVNPAFVNMMNSTKEHKQIVDLALKLQGHISGESIHASAYILSPHPITDKLPLSVSKDERKRAQETGEPIDNYIIQYDGTITQENWGYVKLDLLAIVDLAMADHAMETIERVYGCKINIENIPLDDKTTFDLLLDGHNSGIFQFDGSPVAIRILTQSGADSIGDWAAVNALNRPGPLQMGYDIDFINGKQNPASVTYFAPSADKILKETYGTVCFQEQLMLLSQDPNIVGFDESEADHLRKVTAKKKKDQLAALRVEIEERAQENNVAPEIYNTFADIAIAAGSYSFNKCVTGDTTLFRAAPYSREEGAPTREIPIVEIYRRFHGNIDGDKKMQNLRSEYGDPKCGLWVMGYDVDGRARKVRVKDVFEQGVREVYKIALSNGKTIKCTDNHRLLTVEGYKMISEMAEGDEIICCDFTSYEDHDLVSTEEYPTYSSEIVSIEPAGREMTYDVEIDTKEHNFFANGICSHNSHALAYAIIAYRNAFLKAWFPAEFFASLATFKPMQKKVNKIPGYLTEAQELGCRVKPPHVNYSMNGFDVPEKGVIAFGLGGIKKVGKAADPIVAEREANGPYKDFTDFCTRVPRTVGKGPLEALIRAGALDDLGWSRLALVESIDEIVEFRKKYFDEQKSKELFEDDLFGGDFFGEDLDPDSSLSVPDCDPGVILIPPFDIEYSERELMNQERETFGMYFRRDPRDFTRVSRYITECEIAADNKEKKSLGQEHPLFINVKQIGYLDDGTKIQTIANVEEIREFNARSGRMANIRVWDNGLREESRFGFSPTKSSVKCTVFAKKWAQMERPLPDDVVLITGRVSKDKEGKWPDAILIDDLEVLAPDSAWIGRTSTMEKTLAYKKAYDEMMARDAKLADPAHPCHMIPAIEFSSADDLEDFLDDPELERFRSLDGREAQLSVVGDVNGQYTRMENLRSVKGLVKLALEHRGATKKIRSPKAERAFARLRMFERDEEIPADTAS